MPQAHASLIADLDDSGVTAALRRMDKNVNATVKGASREFQQLDRVNAAMAAKMQQRSGLTAGGNNKRAMMGGQIALQAQDIAIQAQMGVSASRILVQQGTQIASIFGPQGAIVGGLIAAGVLIWDLVSGTEALDRAAEKANKQFTKMAHENVRVFATEQDVGNDTRVMDEERKRGREAADRLKEQIALEEKKREIRNSGASDDMKNAAIQALDERQRAADQLRSHQEAKKRRMEEVGKMGRDINQRADDIQDPQGASENRRAERARNRALRRAATEKVNEMDKARRDEHGITPRPKGMSEGEKRHERDKLIAAAKLQKDANLTATITPESAQAIADAILATMPK